MSAPSILAIRAGNKSMTRRVIKPQPALRQSLWEWNSGAREASWAGSIARPESMLQHAPYAVGDLVRVKEAWRLVDFEHIDGDWNASVLYRADNARGLRVHNLSPDVDLTWRSPLFMPEWASRYVLRITEVRVERVQDISVEDCAAEGILSLASIRRRHYYATDNAEFALDQFASVWEALHSKPKPVLVKGVLDHYVSYPWEDTRETRDHRGKPWQVMGNPWGWAYSFEVVK